MLVSELWYKWGWLICVFVTGIIILIWGQTLELKKLRLRVSEPIPCECLTLEQTLLYVEKTERFVDQLQKAKRGERNKLIDSINHYRTLLKSSGNEIQY